MVNNKNKTILSVIIPVYNVAQYLHECLNSVMGQYKNGFEVICVNDGSTDNSLDILLEFQSQYPLIKIIDQKNGGLSAARNSGLKIASGKYIYFLDSDDYLFPGVLSNMINLAEAHDLEMAGFNAQKSDGNYYFSITEYVNKVLTGKEYFRLLNQKDHSLPPVPVWLYLYKKEFIDLNELRFIESIVLEDNHFTLKSLFLSKKVMMSDYLIQYHRVTRDGSETSNITRHQIESLRFTARDLFNFYKSHKCNELRFFKRLFLIYVNIAGRVILRKDYKLKAFSNEDARIMKQCLPDRGWIIHYLLLRRNWFRLYNWYINDEYPLLKRNLRRISKVYWKLFSQYA
jgi:glycosyltransferase involved in cell wall biosynthesis